MKENIGNRRRRTSVTFGPFRVIPRCVQGLLLTAIAAAIARPACAAVIVQYAFDGGGGTTSPTASDSSVSTSSAFTANGGVSGGLNHITSTSYNFVTATWTGSTDGGTKYLQFSI